MSAEAGRLIEEGRRAEAAGRLRDARELYRQAAAKAPGHAGAHLNLGAVLEALNDLDGAQAAYAQAVAADERNPYASYNLGRLRFLRGELPAAEALLSRALAGKPDFHEARVVLASVYRTQGRLPQAAATLEAAVAERPDDLGAWSLYGTTLALLRRWPQAEAALRRALAGDASDADGWYWLGNALAGQQRPDEAEAQYRRAIALDAKHAAAWCNLGHVLAEAGASEEAHRCFERSLSLQPQFPDALLGLGNLHMAARRLGEAEACYRRALASEPGFAEAHLNLGHALKDQGEAEAALECYRRALALRPDYAEARWSAAMARVPVHARAEADIDRARTEFAEELEQLEQWCDRGGAEQGAAAVGVQQPFWLAYQERDNRALLERYGRLCARLMARWWAEQGVRVEPPGRGGRIRVAVVGQHFRDHSVWSAIVKGWFSQVDPRRFELYAFALGGAEDAETAYARSRAVRFESGGRPLRRWAEAIAAARPHVVLYPELGMDPMSVKLASLRLAPVQAVSWGHPETSGLPTIDYYLSAELLEPADAQAHYTERLVRLPNLGCHVTRSAEQALPPDLGRWGLRSDTPLLLCPGVPFKYSPLHDDALADIAARVPEGRLVFFAYGVTALSDKLRERLREAFARRGLVLESHALFVPWQPRPAFRGWLERATVYLDTIGFSGFNTALQAVEAGLPIVTREGTFMRGRLASGILTRLGMRDLIADSDSQYVSLAERLSRERDYREAVRARMLEARAALFDDMQAIRGLEEFLAGAVGDACV